MGLDQSSTFHSAFARLIEELTQNKDLSARKRTLEKFITDWEVTYDDVMNRYLSLHYPTQLPLETTERRLAFTLCSYIGSPDYDKGILEKNLFLIAETIPTLHNLSKSDKALDADTYALLTGFLVDIFDSAEARDTTKIMISYDNKKLQTSIYYQNVVSSPVISDVDAIIRQTLDHIRHFHPQLLAPYAYLDLPKGKRTPIFDRMPSPDSIIGHLFDLIPKKVLIVENPILRKINGMTLYTRTMVLNENIVENLGNPKEVTRAKCMVTMFHELAHHKRQRFYAEGQYFKSTPEKILDLSIEVGTEAGFFLEERLFGGPLNLNKITPK